MAELNGTVAVVTGARRGIGREIALHQAQGGATVAVLARTAREIDQTASLINGQGGRAIAIPVDLVDRRADCRYCRRPLRPACGPVAARRR